VGSHGPGIAADVAGALDGRVPDHPDMDPGRRPVRCRPDRLQLFLEHAVRDAQPADAAGLHQPGAGLRRRPGCRALPAAQARAAHLRPTGRLHHRDPATAINELLPSRLSALFWFYRVDLFSLPIFVAGAVAILFGCRVLWRQKVAIAFLFLAWPYPYQKYLLGVLNFFTNSTLVAMEKIAVWTHLATPTGVSTSNPLFTIDHHGTTFALSIVSACSGVNSVVGFLLVGSVFAVIVKGPVVRKVLWLAGGMLLLYVLNIGRITFIFFAGRSWGESIAINVFHPFVGLVLFCVGVVVMLLLIRPLGMRIEIGPADRGGGIPRHRNQQRRAQYLQPGIGRRGSGEIDRLHPGSGRSFRLALAVRDQLLLGQAALR
jgi:exosortase/archaeosortase family protein